MKLTQDGVVIVLEYTEPTANEDGSQLVDLHHTSVYYDMGAGAVNVIDLPASLMTGGGVKEYSFQVPVAAGAEVDVLVWATATDTSGNTSDPSEPLVIRLDRRTPKPPFGLRLGNG